jgi:palmitoyl-protein thioesterase
MHVQRLLVETLAASNAIKKITSISDDERPVVFWHGFGDSYNSTEMQRVFDIVHESKPKSFVHSIHIDQDESRDRRASMFSNLNVDIDIACEQLASIPELATGFDMIGFSQGGLFARAAIERCSLPVKTLITFGSPHSGISDLPKCTEGDWLCKKRNQFLLRSGNIWNRNSQSSIVPAQYFRRQEDYDRYLEYSAFLADVNNEREQRNETYVKNLEALQKLVLIQFGEDETVHPKCTAWFCDLDSEGNTLDFDQTIFYEDDLIGLKTLYDNGSIDFLTINGRHMEISDEYFKQLIETYLGK